MRFEGIEDDKNIIQLENKVAIDSIIHIICEVCMSLSECSLI